MEQFISWLIVLLSGRPHIVIHNSHGPHFLRWFLVPRNPWFNVYLHKFVSSDDRVLHDHPWNFVSIILSGGYLERIVNQTHTMILWRRAPSISFRKATDKHSIELRQNFSHDLKYVPCWTLVFTGPVVREWGFWCPKGFVPWRQYVDSRDHGKTGGGCD